MLAEFLWRLVTLADVELFFQIAETIFGGLYS